MTVHVFPENEAKAHCLDGELCACGPELVDEGLDEAGEPALVVVHRAALN